MFKTPSRFEPAFRIKKKLTSIDSVKLNNNNEIKERLLKEMLELDNQRHTLESSLSTVDFSMRQTYKEMIQSRRVLLEQLSKASI
jgi:hypothetical protein